MTDKLLINEDERETRWVVLVTATTRKALSAKVKDLNWRGGDSSYSPTGTIYANSAHLLRAYKVERGQWCGVVVMERTAMFDPWWAGFWCGVGAACWCL